MKTVGLYFRKYRTQYTGMLAYFIQRATGLLMLAYLFLHIHTIRELRMGPKAFNAALADFDSPLFKLLEIALLGTVILHSLNGVRITLIDAGWGGPRQRKLFWAYTLGVGLVVFAAGAIPLFVFSVLRTR
jgi:succinate dehydrogenase / fumarate reductase cytochrome b subunit